MFIKSVELMKQAISISDNTNYVCEDLLLNASVTIYHHFTIYEWKKYLITTDADKKASIENESYWARGIKRGEERPYISLTTICFSISINLRDEKLWE